MLNNSSASLPHRNIYQSPSQRKNVNEDKFNKTQSSSSLHAISLEDSGNYGGDPNDVSAISNQIDPLEIEEKQGLLSRSEGIDNTRGVLDQASINISYLIVVVGNAYQQGGIQHAFQTCTSVMSSTLSKLPGEYHTIVSCLCYCFCSLTMVLANKALASSYKADIGFLTILFQAVLAVVFLEIFHCYGISKLDLDPVTGSKFDMKLAKKWFPVNCFFVSMLFTGYMSLKYLNVPMVTIFKNLTNVVILFGEWIFQGTKVTGIVLASCLIMVVGAALAASNDITFSFLGYFWMIMNCCCTAGYVLYMKHATKTIQISKNNMVYYNNLLSVPILFVGAFFKGEISTFLENTELLTLSYFNLTLYAGFLGVFLNLATLWCVSNTSATTYAVVGALNKIPLSILGFFLFKTPMTAESAVFISLSMCGGFLYTYGKMQEAKANKVNEGNRSGK